MAFKRHEFAPTLCGRRAVSDADLAAMYDEIERLKARYDHLESQWTGTLTGEIQGQQGCGYEHARAQAEGRVNQALATWDRLAKGEAETDA